MRLSVRSCLVESPSIEDLLYLERHGYKSVGVAIDDANGGQRSWVFVRLELRNPFASMRAPLTLVFDVNGVLGFKWFDRTDSLAPVTHAHMGHVFFFRRPGARRLLRECRKAGHRVVLWSSMQRAYVDAFADVLLARADRKSTLVLCNTDAPRNDEEPEMREGRNVAILKDLEVVWSRLGIHDAAERRRTIIIDDDAHKTRLHAKHRLPPPMPPFRPASPWDTRCVEDSGCLHLLDAIAHVASSDDVVAACASWTYEAAP